MEEMVKAQYQPGLEGQGLTVFFLLCMYVLYSSIVRLGLDRARELLYSLVFCLG